MDYEYEYVYYYYDDDEVDNKFSKIPTTQPMESESKQVSDRSNIVGKSRYDDDINNSSTPKLNSDQNGISISRGKGRQSIPVVEDVAEERLPANTRFPPRSSPSNVQTPNVEETTKKIGVKRPSLDLVDSHTFNRGDAKGTRVAIDDLGKSSVSNNKLESFSSVLDGMEQKMWNSEATTFVSGLNDEATTQVMDKVALDLYAHLANENSHSNTYGTTDISLAEESTTSFESTDKTLSTEEYALVDATTILSTSIGTTTIAPVFSNISSSVEPQKEARRVPSNNGRNHFRSRPTSQEVVSEIPVEVNKVSATEASPPKLKSKCILKCCKFKFKYIEINCNT